MNPKKDYNHDITLSNLTDMFYNESSLSAQKAKEIFDVIKRQENVSLLWLPGGGRTHFGYNLQTKAGLSSFIPDNILDKLTFILVDFDVDLESFKEQIKDSLEVFSDTTNVYKSIRAITQSNAVLYFVVDNFVYEPSKVRYLNLIRSINFQRVKCVFLTSFAELYSSKQRQIATENYMFHNVVTVGYFTKPEAVDWIKTQARELNLRVSEEQVSKLLEFCGGIPALIKNYLRGLKNYDTPEKVENSDEMANITHSLWNAFSDEEKRTLKKIHLTKTFKVRYLSVLEYLRKNNLVDDNGVVGTWIGKVLGEDSTITLENSKGRLIWDGYDITDNFSSNELKGLYFLLKRSGDVKREEIGDLIYGGHYTEWSIDKFISRLRHKLFEIGIGKDKLITLKGVGYKVVNLNLKD